MPRMRTSREKKMIYNVGEDDDDDDVEDDDVEEGEEKNDAVHVTEYEVEVDDAEDDED